MTPQELGDASTDIPPSPILSLFCPFTVEKSPDSKHLGPWCCCNVHPVWQARCLRWCLSPDFSLTLLGKGAISTPGMAVHHKVPVPTLTGDGIFCVLIFEDWQIDFHMVFYLPTVSALVWMPGASRPIRSGWHWWGCWCWILVPLKPMVWWGQGWWGQNSP